MPAWTRLTSCPAFEAGRIFRPARAVTTPGGKGINVARVYRTLGGEATALGFLGGANGDFIERGLRAEGIPAAFVRVGGESRVCIKVMDPESGAETELNENGPEVTSADADALLARLRELLPGRDAVIISGSMPPGTPPDLYARIITLAQQEMGVKAILDTSGPALVSGAQAAPFLLKPNVHELDALDIGGDGWAESASGSATHLRRPTGDDYGRPARGRHRRWRERLGGRPAPHRGRQRRRLRGLADRRLCVGADKRVYCP